MADFIVKQDDRREPIERTLKGSDGVAVNLTGSTVRFLMRGPVPGSSTLKVNTGATIVDAPTGKVRYSWAAGDTDTQGLFEAEFEVTFGDGTRQTFPNDGFISVLVAEDLG